MDVYADRRRQIVDWHAVVGAGLISGISFLMIDALLKFIVADNPWLFLSMVAAFVVGPGIILEEPAFSTYVVAMALHLPLSFLFTALVATVIHRWGLVVGILGGGLLGLSLYFINFYAVTLFFPWFAAQRGWLLVIAHVLFGGLAGGLYEALEVEIFVPVGKYPRAQREQL